MEMEEKRGVCGVEAMGEGENENGDERVERKVKMERENDV